MLLGNFQMLLDIILNQFYERYENVTISARILLWKLNVTGLVMLLCYKFSGDWGRVLRFAIRN